MGGSGAQRGDAMELSSSAQRSLGDESDDAVAAAAALQHHDMPGSSNGIAAAAQVSVDQHGQDLPMSKAKCIALVATVTGAAFLNASCSSPQATPTWNIQYSTHCVSNTNPPPPRLTARFPVLGPQHTERRHHSTHHRPVSRYPRESAAMDRLVLLAHLWLLSPALGPHW
jgi:hypothetical protein